MHEHCKTTCRKNSEKTSIKLYVTSNYTVLMSKTRTDHTCNQHNTRINERNAARMARSVRFESKQSAEALCQMLAVRVSTIFKMFKHYEEITCKTTHSYSFYHRSGLVCGRKKIISLQSYAWLFISPAASTGRSLLAVQPRQWFQNVN